MRQKQVTLSGQVVHLQGRAELTSGRHEYIAPYDKGRLGKPYPQRFEPFVELRATTQRFRSLSLFCVTGPQEPVELWGGQPGQWRIRTPEGVVQVGVDQDRLIARNVQSKQEWRIDRQ